jgi:crotonobetainyl-CoA:carnitine CoA-transferase CaiB-like acyl-CoA transferase
MDVKVELLESLLSSAGREARDTDIVQVRGADPVYDTRFRIGEAAAAVLAACGLAVSDLWEAQTGRSQHVGIDVEAAAAALLSFAHLRGEAAIAPRRGALSTTALFPAKDGWVHLHGGFPHLHEGTLSLLGCSGDPEEVARAVAGWEAQALEDALAERGLCGARVRTASEWAGHAQAVALAGKPVVEIERIGDSPPEPLPGGGRPLAGVRVLDLTRVLAGPTCGRTLAEHGADVMRIHGPHLPFIPPFATDTGHGKLSAALDLRSEPDIEKLRGLVRDGDVFSRGYRKGALDRRGFSAPALADLRPGIIVVSINCYGHEGPWAGRGGWEQLAQTVTGIAAEQGGLESPRLLPAAATDYITGYLGAFGALVALERRAREGGSYEVRVSLARSAMWLLASERVDGTASGLDAEALAARMTSTDVEGGTIQHLAPVLELSETPPRWERPTVALGTHAPVWPGR